MNNKTLAILGAGEQGKQIAHFAIRDNHYSDIIFFDDFITEDCFEGYKVLGNSSKIKYYFEKRFFDEIIIGIGYKHLEKKEEFYNKLKKDKIPFGRIIHSSAWVDNKAIIEEGCVIYPNTCIDAYVHIKSNTIINLSCTIAHNTIIGSHSYITPRVAIAGFVNIENRCFIGINSTIINNIHIASDIKIGAGTLVLNNLTKKGLYFGAPSKYIKKNNSLP